MLIYTDILIEMAIIVLPIMLVAVVAGDSRKFISIWSTYLQQNH